ncbi:LCP family protein [Gordonia araii]|uniref:LCP family protein n=1 Tax=Gordonia araii TaxID=263909 RepID=UPI000311F905|nr:LCP family protein [Gordonia araii]
MNDPRQQPNLRRRRQEQDQQAGTQSPPPRPRTPGPAPRSDDARAGQGIPAPPRPPARDPAATAQANQTPVYQPPLAWSAPPNDRPANRTAQPRQAQPGRAPQRPGQGPNRRPAPPPAGRETGRKYAPTQTPEPLPSGERVNRAGAGGKPPTGKPPRRATNSDKPRQPKPARPKKRRRLVSVRGVLTLLLVLIITALVAAVGGLVYYDGKLTRVNALNFGDRIRSTPGTNWLIVGTDSRDGMTAAERRKLSTGPDEGGARTDTIMLVSKPTSGPTAIVSIPRDLFVEIPDGYGQHKINAAFNMGGPQLLVRTVEALSGVHIDHYAEIGFGGFANVVDAIGGIDICLKQSLRDPKAGLRLRAGCQKINGRQALGLVRSRDFPNADLQRVVNQRKVFAALMAKATSPGVLLNPFQLLPFVDGIVGALTVDTNDHSWDLLALAWGLRGSALMVTVPTGGQVWSGDGDSLAVGSNTEEFFARLARGLPVDPKSVDEGDAAIG